MIQYRYKKREFGAGLERGRQPKIRNLRTLSREFFLLRRIPMEFCEWIWTWSVAAILLRIAVIAVVCLAVRGVHLLAKKLKL
jgi:hypothetical protein